MKIIKIIDTDDTKKSPLLKRLEARIEIRRWSMFWSQLQVKRPCMGACFTTGVQQSYHGGREHQKSPQRAKKLVLYQQHTTRIRAIKCHHRHPFFLHSATRWNGFELLPWAAEWSHPPAACYSSPRFWFFSSLLLWSLLCSRKSTPDPSPFPKVWV